MSNYDSSARRVSTGGRPAGEADPGTPMSFYVFMGLLAVALLYFLAVLILA